MAEENRGCTAAAPCRHSPRDQGTVIAYLRVLVALKDEGEAKDMEIYT